MGHKLPIKIELMCLYLVYYHGCILTTYHLDILIIME